MQNVSFPVEKPLTHMPDAFSSGRFYVAKSGAIRDVKLLCCRNSILRSTLRNVAQPSSLEGAPRRKTLTSSPIMRVSRLKSSGSILKDNRKSRVETVSAYL